MVSEDDGNERREIGNQFTGEATLSSDFSDVWRQILIECHSQN